MKGMKTWNSRSYGVALRGGLQRAVREMAIGLVPAFPVGHLPGIGSHTCITNFLTSGLASGSGDVLQRSVFGGLDYAQS